MDLQTKIWGSERRGYLSVESRRAKRFYFQIVKRYWLNRADKTKRLHCFTFALLTGLQRS